MPFIFYLNKKGEKNMEENEDVLNKLKKINNLLARLIIKYSVFYILIGFIIGLIIGVIIGLFIGYIKVV
jgi:ABC-type nitrate/sulfonate/bicarbonate transport system permease component